MTLEERLSQIADLLTAKRATNWTLGDEYCEAVKEHGKGVVGSLATLARCSAEHIRQCIRVGVAYPDKPGVRLPDVDWSIYRESLMAAKRGKVDAMATLATCLDKDMSLSEIRWLYRSPDDKPPVLRFAATCAICGARTVTHIGDMAKAQAHGGFAENGILCIVCSVCGRFIGKVE